MDIISIALCASDMTLRRHRFHAHSHNWTAKDIVIFIIGIGAFFFARHFIPKFFGGMDEKKLNNICAAIAVTVMAAAFILSSLE